MGRKQPLYGKDGIIQHKNPFAKLKSKKRKIKLHD
jgi:hypothetical protein